MSYISDVVVVVHHVSAEQEAALTAPLEFDTERQQALVRIDTVTAGGTKVFTSRVYAAAFNYLPVDEFIDWIVDLLGDRYDAVVWIDTEGDVQVLRPGCLVHGSSSDAQYR